MRESTGNIILVKVRILAGDRVRLLDIDGNKHIISRKEALRRHYVSNTSPKFFDKGVGKAMETVIAGNRYFVNFRTAGDNRGRATRICAYIRCMTTGRRTTSNLRETLDGQYFQFENYNIHADGYIEELWDESKAEEYEMAEQGF